MKHKTIAIFVTILLAFSLLGCGEEAVTPSPTSSPSSIPGSDYYSFISYAAMVQLEYHETWSYDGGEEVSDEEGLAASFSLANGQGEFSVQYLFMDEADWNKNVWLNQLDMDEIVEEGEEVGPFDGRMLTGTTQYGNVVAYAGRMPWYDTGLYLVMHIYFSAPDDYVQMESARLEHTLQSVQSIATEFGVPEVPGTMLNDFSEFGITICGTEHGYFQTNTETDLVHQDFYLDDVGNEISVLCARVPRNEINDIYHQLETEIKATGGYFPQFSRSANGATGRSLYNGKWNVFYMRHTLSGDTANYVMVSAKFRPDFGQDFYDLAQEMFEKSTID
ncbi:hypothetical protein LJC55_00105 [Eubacteriales bacterium OttesenSCG-928-N14]|nr:hypothetical protein [Eubacteriales bacterium OttesenSCG-928-N14]